MRAPTFGNRFVSEFRRLGGSTRNWPERALALVDEADRRNFFDALAKVSSQAAKQLMIAAHSAEPENLAKRAVTLMNPIDAGGDVTLLGS
jgi:hypothetical protein